MSVAQRAELIAAAGALEDALQRLAAARAGYMVAYRAVSRAAHPNLNQQATIEDAIGGARLHGLLVQRLRALGLEAVLQRARTAGTQDETWVAALSEKIRAFVS
ncbi:MAG: hypothetical protein ACRD1S_00965 [Vicinamibacterales bacterium]